MRLDKYLKVSRILKRRTVSKELAVNERITINGKIAKPSKEVKIGDIIEITYGTRVMKIKVLDIKDVVRKNDASILYEVLEEYKVEQNEKQDKV
ncbi:MAG TPA: RNA-binding S4 domain-containing protein [Erysipelotrichaceae bacterium]|jgi:ribosomal 50S subunit-recycling heat shock protein|nr:RNA-binding S4 domain-containing protein [Erysipelotrichia bacterium]HPX31903.1 RNA-binding S4 domain-containing protein [Erysipelotrichaceae bacterium]HQA84415.1 RNA-binding S4 domain-containing protein [Erysipelotrichaceae bacterium]